MTNRTDSTNARIDATRVDVVVPVTGGTWRWQWTWSTAGATRTW